MVFSSQTLDMVVSMLSTEFDRVRVMNPQIRHAVVQRMLEDNDFIDDALGKYEIDDLFRGNTDFSDFMPEVNAKVITLDVSLSSSEQMVLNKANKDVRLVFEPGPVMQHGFAYVQRIIDTDRCLRSLSNYGGDIIDIGGNYSTHARQCRLIHSCTLMNSAREMHRQTERMVQLRSANISTETLNMCTVGAQRCDVQATQSMSIHAITDILWSDWPTIMDRHGLSYHVAVFHYDPIMLTAKSGKLEGSYMYYEIDGDNVHFHFEGDSSLSYTHSWSNFRKYTSPWTQFSTNSEWAYIYDIKYIEAGVATAEIVRVHKVDLGVQVRKPIHAYVPMEDFVSVSTFVYDKTKGLPRSDSAAFCEVKLMVDRDMYNFMHVYGISNDTANPNKPVTPPEFRAMCRTYNQTRKFGEETVSGRRVLDGLQSIEVYDALYHLVAYDRALLSARAAAITSSMIIDQRVNDSSALRIAAMVPLCAIGAAAIAAYNVYDYYLAKFTEVWRQYLFGNIKLATANNISSYIPVPYDFGNNIDGYFPSLHYKFERLSGFQLTQPIDKYDDDAVAQAISELASPVSEASDNFLCKDDITEDGGTTCVPSETATSGIRPLQLRKLSEVNDQIDNDRDIMFDTSHQLLSADDVNVDFRVNHKDMMEQYSTVVRNNHTVKFGILEEPDVTVLHANHREAMLEFAIYSFDVAHGVMSTLRRVAKEVCPAGKFCSRRAENMNQGQDLGVRNFDLTNRELPHAAKDYAVGVNPIDGRVHVIKRRSDDTCYVETDGVRSIVVTDKVKIFNQLAVANGVLKSLKAGYTPRYTMTLIDGVPGCGKTSEIVDNFSLNDVVLCAVRHSKDDTLSRLLKKFSDVNLKDTLKARVRTLDSIVMHGFRANGPVKTVFIDEGLMAFPGQLYSALEKLRPNKVKVMGDQHQIKVIDRSPSLGALIYQGVPKWTSVEQRNTSYSMPADVCVVLSKKVYGRQILTTSPVRRSMEVLHHKSITDDVFKQADVGWDYMSVLTADKGKLLTGIDFLDGKKLQHDAIDDGSGVMKHSKTKRPVFTVHEAQGQRLNRTRVVRMNVNTAAVLNSTEHVVVAMSRHYYKCQYHTMGAKDLLFEYMSTQVLDSDMDKIMLPANNQAIERIEMLKQGDD